MNVDFNLALTVLITGFLVVFSLLLILIAVIKLYGTIVYNIQNKPKKEKKSKKEVAEDVISTPEIQNVETFSNSLSGEMIAVISAAVDSIYGAGKVRVKGIKKTKSEGMAWRNAGVMNNTRPF